MYLEKIRNIIYSLKQRDGGDPFFANNNYVAKQIDKNNFVTLNKKDGKICFIDGGNASIISAPDFNLSMIRIYYCVYEDKTKIGHKREDYYVIVTPSVDNKLFYNAELIPVYTGQTETFLFDTGDVSMRVGLNVAEIDTIPGIIRRFAELKMAERVCAEAKAGVVVLDGSLQMNYVNENKYANALYEEALRNNVIVSGLSKTSSLVTTTGLNLMSTINKLGPDGRWYYNPIVDITNPDHRAVMFAVKLHKHASICYRYEIFDQQISAASDAISLLAFNSNDLRYPGYPYGLIDADAFARISEREQKYQQTMFAMLRSQMASVNAGDAHDVINRIVG